MTSGFIKANRLKHINPYIFRYTQVLTEFGQIDVTKIELSHNTTDMLTKALPAYKHETLVYDVGMRFLYELIST